MRTPNGTGGEDVTPDRIDERLRELGIPHETIARDGSEPPYIHIRVDGRPANWYSTAPLGIMMMKSDIAVYARQRPARITIELGKHP